MRTKTLIQKFIQHFINQIEKNEYNQSKKSGEMQVDHEKVDYENRLYSDRDILFVFIRTVNRIARRKYYGRYEFQEMILESLKYLDSKRQKIKF